MWKEANKVEVGLKGIPRIIGSRHQRHAYGHGARGLPGDARAIRGRPFENTVQRLPSPDGVYSFLVPLRTAGALNCVGIN